MLNILTPDGGDPIGSVDKTKVVICDEVKSIIKKNKYVITTLPLQVSYLPLTTEKKKSLYEMIFLAIYSLVINQFVAEEPRESMTVSSWIINLFSSFTTTVRKFFSGCTSACCNQVDRDIENPVTEIKEGAFSDRLRRIIRTAGRESWRIVRYVIPLRFTRTLTEDEFIESLRLPTGIDLCEKQFMSDAYYSWI